MTNVSSLMLNKKFELESQQINLGLDLRKYAQLKNEIIHSYEDGKFFVHILGIVYSLESVSGFDNSDIEKCIYRYGSQMFNELDGNFSFFFLDKVNNEFYAYTDRSSLFPIYYSFENKTLSVSNRIDVLSIAKSKQAYDETAIRRFISTGYYLSDDTICSDVKKLKPGCSLVLKEHSCSTEPYFEYDISEEKNNLSDLIQECDLLFKSAIEKHYNFCVKHEFSVGALLSGGMDSRLTAATLKSHVNELSVFNFGEKSQFDCVMAKRISRKMRWKYTHLPIMVDNEIERFYESIELTEGRTSFENHIGFLLALDTLAEDKQSPNSIFTGQVGATVGALAFSVGDEPPRMLNASYFPQVDHSYATNFKSVEELMLYNLSFNGSTVGESLNYKFALPFSPFLEAKFIEFSKKIPLELKLGRQFYLKWAIQEYPSMAKFPWSQTGLGLKDSLFVRQKHTTVAKKIRNLLLRRYGKKRKEKLKNKRRDSTTALIVDDLKNALEFSLESRLSPSLYSDLSSFLEQGSIKVKCRILTVLGYIEYLENIKKGK